MTILEEKSAKAMGAIGSHETSNEYTVERVICALRSAGFEPRQEGKQWRAKCPAHDDHTPSLTVRAGENGRVLVRCWSGCNYESVLRALGLWREGAQTDNRHTAKLRTEKAYPTLEGAMKAAARSAGGELANLYDYGPRGPWVVRITFPSKPKEFRPIHLNGDGGFVIGDPPGLWPLYRQNEVHRASCVYVMEGEQCVDAATRIGLPSITSAHGSKSAPKSNWEPLRCKTTVVLPDNDDAGEHYAKSVAAILDRLGCAVKIVRLPGLATGGDIVNFIEHRRSEGKDDAAIRREIENLTESTPIWQPSLPHDPAEHDTASGEVTLQPILGFAQLRRAHPHLNPPVVDGLLRRGETMNIIAPPKVGKSWLTYDLLLAIRTGGLWLETFKCSEGPVLLIDNELHRPTIAYRIPLVCKARGIDPAILDDGFDVLALRGCRVSIQTLRPYLRRVENGFYKMILCDAKYRLIAPGTRENDNTDEKEFYNLVDEYAAMSGAAWGLVHHSSKGSQSDKSVVDVGAGGSAQARAADCHVILREHDEPGHVVLEAAVRSFPAVLPLGLEWDFPVWRRDDLIDIGALKGRKTPRENRQDDRDATGKAKIVEALQSGRMTASMIRAATGLSKDRTDRLINMLLADKKISYERIIIRGNEAKEYRIV